MMRLNENFSFDNVQHTWLNCCLNAGFVSRRKVKGQTTTPPEHGPFMAVFTAAFTKREL